MADRIDRVWVCMILFFFAATPGCQNKTTVSGHVTYNGQAVNEGFITFFPVDTNGNVHGTSIIDGSYSIVGISQGKKKVLIRKQPKVIRVSPGGKGEAEAKIVPPDQPIPDDAIGNNAIVEIGQGDQKQDFELLKPRQVIKLPLAK